MNSIIFKPITVSWDFSPPTVTGVFSEDEIDLPFLHSIPDMFLCNSLTTNANVALRLQDQSRVCI